MNARRPITLLALGLLCLLGSQSVAAQLTPQDEAAIRAIHDAALASLTSGDIPTYVGLMREDVVLQPPNAPSFHGRAAVGDWARALHSSPLVSLTWPNFQMYGNGNLAYVTTDYVSQLGNMPPGRGKQLAVYRRDGGGRWQIAAVSFNSDLPAVQNTAASHEAAATVLYSVWNTKEYDRLDAALAPGFRRQGSDGGAEGLAAWKAYMRQIHTTYPDFHIEVRESVYNGDTGVTHWTLTATDAATGRRIEIPGMSLLRFANGMITEQIAYFDPAPLQAQ